MGDIIIIDRNGDAASHCGTSIPLFDFNLGDIARFETDEEAESFMRFYALTPDRGYTIGELPEELRDDFDSRWLIKNS